MLHLGNLVSMEKKKNRKKERVFLVQSSGKPSKHLTSEYDDRTYAEELILHNYYRNDNWEVKKRDLDFGEVRVGDYIAHYCTNNVEQSPGRIKYIYKVDSIERIPPDEIREGARSGRTKPEDEKRLPNQPHILRLKRDEELDWGVSRSTIIDEVDKGNLSQNMAKCGKHGFNIAKIEPDDLARLKVLPRMKESDVTPYSGYEEDLRHYLVRKRSATVLSPDYAGFELYEDESGNTGELYRTSVGEIDMLYKNSEDEYLVLELKRTEEEVDKVVGQIARYIGWVAENLAKGGNVKGAIVAQSHSAKLKYAVEALRDCKLLAFSVDFKFGEADEEEV